MQAGNSYFFSIALLQIIFQQYLGRGTGISCLSKEIMELQPLDTHQAGMKAFSIEIFTAR